MTATDRGFRTATRCGSSACVGVNLTGPDVLVGDTKDGYATVLTIDPGAWARFVQAMRR